MSLTLALLAAAAPVTPPAPVFDCGFGTKQLTVTQQGDALVYRYGSKRKAELRLVADAKSGRVFYHRTLYPRGEDQTLRFVNGDYQYVVYSHWTAAAGPDIDLETAAQYSGLIVMKDGKTLSTRSCQSGGDMVEWPIFKALPQDSVNRVPAE